MESRYRGHCKWEMEFGSLYGSFHYAEHTYVFHIHNNLTGPTKTVRYREVSTIEGVYKRFYCPLDNQSRSYKRGGL